MDRRATGLQCSLVWGAIAVLGCDANVVTNSGSTQSDWSDGDPLSNHPSGAGSQPGAIVWEDFFDDNGGAEVGNGVAADSGDNVYVCGAADDGVDVDALVRKYDRDGALVWEAGFATDNNDVAMACASDRQDHLLVAGASGSDGFVGKYTSDGRALWTRNVGAQALGVTVDPAGNVTVAAERRDSGGFANAQVRSYNPDGSVRWQVSRGTPLGDDRAHAVAADERGNVVVAGQLFCDREDTFVAKYDRNGALVWDASWLATAGDDGALAVAVDSDGTTWVAGYVTGAGLDGVLIKLDCRGQELLRVPIDHGALDVATGVAVGGDGSVVVSGFSLVTGGTLDAWIKKYDPSGGSIWSAWLDRGANDQAFAVAVDRSGDVIGVGASTDPRTASDDLWVRKHFR